MTYGLLPLHIILTSRSKDELVLCVSDSPVSKIQLLLLSKNSLGNHLPIVIVEQFNSHIAAPLLMSGLVDLSETTRAFYFPVIQIRVSNLRVSGRAAQCHSSLEYNINEDSREIYFVIIQL